MAAEPKPQKGEVYRAGLAKPTLGARLLCAAKSVRAGSRVADIGCDHGKLAVWLALAGCPKVIAVDAAPLPLARARALALQCGCRDAVDCRLGSGLAPLAPGEAQDIVIAGLSGETIADILAPCAWIRTPETRLVLVPATRHPHLRRWLCENGFSIQTERAVAEKGRYYAVICAHYTGNVTRPGDVFYQVGLVPQCGDEAARGYIAARLRVLHKQALGLKGAQLQAHQKLIQEVTACLP